MSPHALSVTRPACRARPGLDAAGNVRHTPHRDNRSGNLSKQRSHIPVITSITTYAGQGPLATCPIPGACAEPPLMQSGLICVSRSMSAKLA